MMTRLQRARGTVDILPIERPYWQEVRDSFRKIATSWGFEEIETPLIESKNLFVRALGSDSDIVIKELFEVNRTAPETEPEDKTEEKEGLVLRPENTAGVVRAYVENGMYSLPQPVKLFYLGPMFRGERPQKGRLRQFNQVGLELIGELDPTADAMIIQIAWQYFKALKLQKLVMEINSIGDKNCRSKLRKTLASYLENFANSLSKQSKQRLRTNVFRILDSKDPADQEIIASAPQLVDQLCDDCKKHFMAVLEILDELEIPYELNPRLVRGLDYYTKTIFEFREQADSLRQSSLAAGGRYDELFESYGERPTPAVGIAFGLERIIEKMKEQGIEAPPIKKVQVFVVQLGEKAKMKSLPLVAKLNSAGFSTSCALGRQSLKSQLRAADSAGADLALIIGQKEAIEKSVLIRDLHDGSQEEVKLDKLEEVLKNKLKK